MFEQIQWNRVFNFHILSLFYFDLTGNFNSPGIDTFTAYFKTATIESYSSRNQLSCQYNILYYHYLLTKGWMHVFERPSNRNLIFWRKSSFSSVCALVCNPNAHLPITSNVNDWYKLQSRITLYNMIFNLMVSFVFFIIMHIKIFFFHLIIMIKAMCLCVWFEVKITKFICT